METFFAPFVYWRVEMWKNRFVANWVSIIRIQSIKFPRRWSHWLLAIGNRHQSAYFAHRISDVSVIDTRRMLLKKGCFSSGARFRNNNILSTQRMHNVLLNTCRCTICWFIHSNNSSIIPMWSANCSINFFFFFRLRNNVFRIIMDHHCCASSG